MCIANTTTNYTTFVSAGFGLLGVLIGSFIGRINSMAMIKRQEFNKGAAEFRTAFVDYIHKLKHTPDLPSYDAGWLHLRDDHIELVEGSHEKAKIRFEPFLDKMDLTGFNAAWNEYLKWPEHFNTQDDKTHSSQEILGHIANLLKYANPKI